MRNLVPGSQVSSDTGDLTTIGLSSLSPADKLKPNFKHLRGEERDGGRVEREERSQQRVYNEGLVRQAGLI